MKKSLGLLIGLALVLAAVGVVFASQGNKYGKAVTPPFPQPAEKDLQKIIFIRYAPGKEPLPVCDYDGVCEPRENWKTCPSDCPKEEEPTTACYAFLSGAKPKWNWVEDYAYSETGLGTSSAWVTGTWEAPTSGDIFGTGVSGTYPWGVYDYQNAVSYGNYSDPNVIAVTAIWFRAKNIYEYDIMFDTDYFPGTVDLDSVALHEFGHGAGLNDLYDSVCSDEVMYGYYTGIKTTLGSGDTTGIQTLYGI
jgi:hypothetical protein